MDYKRLSHQLISALRGARETIRLLHDYNERQLRRHRDAMRELDDELDREIRKAHELQNAIYDLRSQRQDRRT